MATTMKVLVVLSIALVFHSALLSLGFETSSKASPSLFAQGQTINCSVFDASQIKLVTFDTFAALTLLEESLTDSVQKLLPELNKTEVNNVVDQWIEAYASNLGLSFDLSVTGPYPFRWMVNTSIHDILEGMNVPMPDNATLIALEDSWGNLIPRTGANTTLFAIQSAGLQVGPLSNGDYYTLRQAFSAFEPLIPNYVFSSDYPVMCFKNCSTIYQHVLEVTGYTANQYLHVAGSDYDAEGARAAGVFSAVLASYENGLNARLRAFISSSPRDSTDTYSPCFVIEELTDILPILGVYY